jgi:hypothetical protein
MSASGSPWKDVEFYCENSEEEILELYIFANAFMGNKIAELSSDNNLKELKWQTASSTDVLPIHLNILD